MNIIHESIDLMHGITNNSKFNIVYENVGNISNKFEVKSLLQFVKEDTEYALHELKNQLNSLIDNNINDNELHILEFMYDTAVKNIVTESRAAYHIILEQAQVANILKKAGSKLRFNAASVGSKVKVPAQVKSMNNSAKVAANNVKNTAHGIMPKPSAAVAQKNLNIATGRLRNQYAIELNKIKSMELPNDKKAALINNARSNYNTGLTALRNKHLGMIKGAA